MCRLRPLVHSARGQDHPGAWRENGGVDGDPAIDKDNNLTADELGGFSDALFDKIDQQKTGKVSEADLRGRFLFSLFSSGPRRGGAPTQAKGKPGTDHQVGTWPEFNRAI